MNGEKALKFLNRFSWKSQRVQINLTRGLLGKYLQKMSDFSTTEAPTTEKSQKHSTDHILRRAYLQNYLQQILY